MDCRAAISIFIVLACSVCLTNSDEPVGPAKPPDRPVEKDICGEPVTTPRNGYLVSHTRFTRCTYPVNLNCVWELQSIPQDKDSRLEFSFAAYEMPNEKQPCEQSYLKFIDGHNPNGKVFKSLCEGRSLPEPFKSVGNKVRVEFKAGTFPARGFKLNWKLTRFCRPGDFICGNSECIAKESHCDGGKGEFLRDCSDGTDEKNCPILSSCPAGELLCDHKLKCYKENYRCDGVEDCRDGSDEKNCPDLKCSKNNQYICSHKKRCYNDTLRCNGKDDCRDNSDEKNCAPKVCKTGEFRCNHTYNCTKMSYRCDAVNDCNDGSDEWGCPKSVDCAAKGKFQCANKIVCVEKDEQCDGKKDCRSDGSDEAGCKKVQRCKKGAIQCAHQYRCVNIKKVCDGVKDCSDNSDEEKCKSDGMTCPDTQFKCKRAVCIDKSERCDKRNDCMDNSDEENCLYIDGRGPPCGLNHVWCPKKEKCLRAALACNGKDDCGDNSDEANCATGKDVCKIDWVRCKNQQHINLAKRCEPGARCVDGSHTKLPTPCPARTPSVPAPASAAASAAASAPAAPAPPSIPEPSS